MEEYANRRLRLVWVSAATLPTVMVMTATAASTGTH